MNDKQHFDYMFVNEATPISLSESNTQLPYGTTYVLKNSGNNVETCPNGAVREVKTDRGRFDLISPYMEDRLAKWYEAGAKVYGDRNWEKGIPFSSLLCSAKRHLNRIAKGLHDEDHEAATVWNIAAMIHFQELGRTDLNDLPKYKAGALLI
jgi:hypothetical protein